MFTANKRRSMLPLFGDYNNQIDSKSSIING